MKKVNLLLKSRKELLMKIIESSFEILLAQIPINVNNIQFSISFQLSLLF